MLRIGQDVVAAGESNVFLLAKPHVSGLPPSFLFVLFCYLCLFLFISPHYLPRLLSLFLVLFCQFLRLTVLTMCVKPHSRSRVFSLCCRSVSDQIKSRLTTSNNPELRDCEHVQPRQGQVVIRLWTGCLNRQIGLHRIAYSDL